MKPSLSTKVTIGFAIALAMLIFVSVFSYRHITKLIDNVRLVEHTHEVLEELKGIQSSMNDIETGVHGYVITGKDRYLEPYYNAIKVIDQKVNHIRTLTSDNPKQQSRLVTLQPKITEKITHAGEVVNLRKSKGFSAARQLTLTGKGKQVMDDIRRVTNEMKNEENTLLKQRSDKEKANRKTTIFIIVFGNTGAFILVILAHTVANRDITERIRINDAITEQTHLALFTAEVCTVLTRSKTLRISLQGCVESVVKHLDAAFARIWTLNERENMLELQTSAGMYTHIDGPHGRIPVGKFKIGLIAQERKPHLTNAVIGDPRVGDQEWARREGMVAFAGYPLVVEDNLVGVVAMFSRKQLNETTLKALESVADTIALGIQQKHADEMVRNNEARIRAILNTTVDGIITINEQGIVESFNPSAEKIFGYHCTEVIGNNVNMLMPEPYHSEHQRYLENYLKTGVKKIIGIGREVIGKRKDVSTFPVDLSVSEVRLDNRRIFTGIIRDITARKRAEEEIHKLSQSIEQSPVTVIITGTKGTIEYVNPTFERLTGYTTAEVIGQNPRILKSGETTPEEYKRLWDTIISGHNWTGEFHNKKKSGELFWTSSTISPVINHAGVITHFLDIAEDVTARKLAEEELKKAKVAADAATQAKTEFLANMSHEIRTPMNAIIGMTELTLETELTQEQRGFLNVVKSSSETLLYLINDILDFSKIEAGHMEIDTINFDLRELVENVAEILNMRAASKGIDLISYINPEIPTRLAGDPNRLRQIIVNLVGNAIKFTDMGEVVIKVEQAGISERIGDDKKKLELHFMVSDTGIGISKADQEKLFKKFSQVDTSSTRKFGGTGLGLSISKALIELMGGHIWIESELGKGSTFHFNLPFDLQKGKGEKVDFVYPEIKGFPVLVVDDSTTNRFILNKMLSAWGFQVKEADCGAAALSLLRDKANTFNMIILDHHMPVMDGFEVAKAIKNDPGLCSIKIMMLSSAGKLNHKQIQEYGIDESIAKPVKQSTLFDAIMQVLRIPVEKAVTAAPVVSKEVQPGRKHLRILVAEDNVDNQNLAKNFLQKAGYTVGIAENGKLAVDAVRNFHCDLILMDVQMPEMDGFEATGEIRRWEKEQCLERIPIIALTAHAVEGYREKCLESGMDAYITKPIKKIVLLETIGKWIDSRPTVLVADDSVDIRELIKNYLKKETDLRLFFGRNGQEALDMVRRRIFSLVLMNMEMPVMDGYTAATAIRKLENGQGIPIIAMTAHAGTSEGNKCLNAGCTAYIPKQIRKDKLLEVIYQYIPKQDS